MVASKTDIRRAAEAFLQAVSELGRYRIVISDNIASRRPMRPIGPEAPWPAGLRFLSPTSLPLLFDFPPDMARLPASVNRLSNQVLVHTYETEWGRIK